MPEEVNPAEIAASIGSELFGSSMETEETATAPQTQETAPETLPAATQSSLKSLPKSWRKEMEAHWAKMDPSVHDYVYEREANMMRGLQQYSDGHKRWNALLEPYQELLSQHSNVDPVQLMQGLMNAHLQMAQGTPEQKIALAKQMLQHYGVSLDGQAQEPNSELLALRKELQELKSGLHASQKAAFETTYREKLSLVEKFAADPKNEFYGEVADDIRQILQAGLTRDLAEAYEIACYRNPVIRQKLIAKQAEAANGSSKKAAFPNLDANGGSPPARAVKPGSMDDTINGVVAKYFPTH